MTKQLIEPYLFFDGRCEEALEFYRRALGARVDMVLRYKDSPEPLLPGKLRPGFEGKVLHASFHVGDRRIMASDRCGEAPGFNGFSLSLTVSTEADADRCFSALADGGHVQMQLTTTFWSPRFGMVTDRFGVAWMVTVVMAPT